MRAPGRALTAAVVLLVAACGGGDDQGAPPPAGTTPPGTSTPSDPSGGSSDPDAASSTTAPGPASAIPGGGPSATSPSGVPTQAPAPAHGPTDEEGQFPDAVASPTVDATSRAAALRAATAVMRAFARPDLPEDRWWAALAPLLTPAGQQAYRYVDPVTIPARTVNGQPRLVDAASGYLVRVRVRTDAGPYLVLLVRDSQRGPWLAERITPPARAPLTRTPKPSPPPTAPPTAGPITTPVARAASPEGAS